MSFKLKSKDKIVTAFTKIFRRDKLKTDDPHLEESNKNDKVGNDNTDNTLDHANNNNVANRNHFKNELVSPMKNIPKGCSSSSSSNKLKFKTIQVKRLMKELADIEKLKQNGASPPFSVDLVNEKLDEWHVQVYTSSIDSSSELYVDLKKLKIPYILLHIDFPESFPFLPPFIRVISPSIDKGFVMEGGALCLELLTPRGWSSAYSVESVIMQFTASVVKGHGRVSKTLGKSKSFSKKTAEEAFQNLVRTHDKYGWVTPPLTDG
ncbi:hypothetical protein M8J76_015480 [Diaphorina citri]|nr:hypothetical protein M8J75_005687 [Diaphorina citri]KAI5737656.1 hypothetical protein M8J76_015480 [Diaphorina citri]